MADSTTNDSTMVSLGKFKVGGYAYWAPAGTTPPEDSSTVLPAAFKLLGYLSEDGLTITSDTDTTEVKDANGTTVLKVISSFSESYQFAMLEILRAEAAKLRYNTDAVTGTDKSMTIKHQMPSDEDFVLVFEIAMSMAMSLAALRSCTPMARQAFFASMTSSLSAAMIASDEEGPESVITPNWLSGTPVAPLMRAASARSMSVCGCMVICVNWPMAGAWPSSLRLMLSIFEMVASQPVSFLPFLSSGGSSAPMR